MMSLVVRDTTFRNAVNDKKESGIQEPLRKREKGKYFINGKSKLISLIGKMPADDG